MKRKISITIDERALQDIDSVVDNIYIKNRSQAIEHLVKNALGEKRAAVLMLGGDERRLDLGDGTFRPLARIGDKTLVERAIDRLRENHFTTLFIIARHKVLSKLFEILKTGEDHGVHITYIEEKQSSGTFSSLSLARGKISTPFLVVYGDILFDRVNLEELWNAHLRQKAMATIMMTTSSQPREKGTLRVEGMKVLEFQQKPKRSDIYLVFSPIFAAEPELLEQRGVSLESDVFPSLASRGLLHGHLSSEKERHIHRKEDLRLLKSS